LHTNATRRRAAAAKAAANLLKREKFLRHAMQHYFTDTPCAVHCIGRGARSLAAGFIQPCAPRTKWKNNLQLMDK